MVINSIKKCDIDVRKTLYNSIIVAGGTSMLTGFNERLHKSMPRRMELIFKFLPIHIKILIIV